MYGSYWNRSSWSSSWDSPWNDYSSPTFSNRWRNVHLHSDTSRPSYRTNEYYYSPSRVRPYSWERDRELERLRRRYRRFYLDRDSSPEPEPKPEPEPELQPEPKPEPKPEPPKEVFAKELKINEIDLHVAKNTKQHRTDMYDRTEERPDPKDEKRILPAELVLRRGDTFLLTLQLDRKFEKEKHDLSIEFTIGEKPLSIKSTLFKLNVDETTDTNVFSSTKWAAQLVSTDKASVTFKVGIPANCIVGEWSLKVTTCSRGKDILGNANPTFVYEHTNDITILFNPWCADDAVYMPDTKLLNEYVLNDSGCLYRGVSDEIGAKAWNFGQFEEACTDAALYLLRKGCASMPAVAMSDPVRVSRVLSQMVNAPGPDGGVLVGNWGDNITGGVSPMKWVGSVNILEQYMDTMRPVKFGQCWVFSGVTTTVCRALGLPCCSVTCFSSAHDTDGSNTIDNFYNVPGTNQYRELNKYLTRDSIWNFHVWNEAWMNRPDLNEPLMNGWQVIDSTPQELSDGLHQCGPCPLYAIKNGKCNIKHDAGFIFSEVNADRIHWDVLPGGSMRVQRKYTHAVGKCISTKKPTTKDENDDGDDSDDDFVRLDVTDRYKHPEGSKEERDAVKLAYDTAIDRREHVYDTREGLRPLDMEIDYDYHVLIGQDLGIRVKVKNHGEHERELKVTVCVYAEGYFGVRDPEPFFTTSIHKVLVPGMADITVPVMLHCQDYFGHLKELFNIKIEVMGEVAALLLPGVLPCLPITEEADTRFRRPDIKVKAPRRAEVDKPVKFELSFKNPLPVALTKCEISIESSHNFYNRKDIKQPDVPVNGVFTTEIELKPKKKGRPRVSFSFDSKELKDISGMRRVRLI